MTVRNMKSNKQIRSRTTTRRTHVVFLWILVFCAPVIGHIPRATAQDATATDQNAPAAEEADTALPEDASEPPAITAQTPDAQQTRDNRQDESIEALRKSYEALEKSLQDERQQHFEREAEQQIQAMEEQENRLKVYGFIDVQWYKFLYPDDAVMKDTKLDNNSFSASHWHLYLDKKLGKSFRTMGEVRFAFQPYGEQISSPYGGAEFERANTKATDFLDAYYFDWGGIAIQRMWIEYKPNDYFGLKVGHYLTPFGVWNVDHGSTVVIPAHRPYIVTSQLLQESQTGLYAYGRIFPSGTTIVDYGFTVSNGRGPVQKIYDLDDHKALGLKLGFSYKGPVSFNLGTYLYWGKMTDTAEVQAVDPVTGKFDKWDEVVAQYYEKAISLHLKIEMFNVLLQGEYVRSMAEYTDAGRPANNIMPTLFIPDHVAQGAYALAAYHLPLKRIHLTPYFMFEYRRPGPTVYVPKGQSYVWGINWRILPSVVWKVEGFYHSGLKGDDTPAGDNHGVINTQLAVSY